LLIERHGRLSCHYAPFEHVNNGAKAVLVGITPGAQQACNALDALSRALAAGASDSDALLMAKETASFSGPMRKNLIAMLDRIGLPSALGLKTSGTLFESRSDLVHYTSALRYPVFLDGDNYSGTPAIMRTPALKAMVEKWLFEEIEQVRDAVWLPLGKEPSSVLRHCVSEGLLREDQVLDGLPHPSPSNAERRIYFLGLKSRDKLSVKTNPDLLDTALIKLTAQVTRYGMAESALHAGAVQ